MDKLNELIAKLKAKSEEIDALLGGEDRTEPLSADDQTKLETLNGEADALRAEIDALKASIEKQNELRRKQTQRKEWMSKASLGRSTTPPSHRQGPEENNLGRQEPEQTDRFAALSQILPVQLHNPRNFAGPDARFNAYASGCWLLAQLGSPDSPVTLKAREWCRQHLAMGESVFTKGGALVPNEFSSAIIMLMQQFGTARRTCRIEPMASETKTVPVNTSGLTAYAVGENKEGTESDAGWSDVNLTAKKWMVLSKYSSELSEDAIVSMADTLASLAARALALKEDQCLFLGDATSTYHGISGLITKVFAAATATYTAISGNTAFGTLDLDDFERMIGMLPDYVTDPRWYISKVGWANSMLRLIEAAGGQTGAMIAGQPQYQFLGLPVEFVQVMNRTTTAQTSTNGLVYCGDMAQAVMFGDRGDMRMAVDGSRYFEYDQLAIRVTERFDIAVHNIGARSDDASDIGPMVGLATPSS